MLKAGHVVRVCTLIYTKAVSNIVLKHMNKMQTCPGLADSVGGIKNHFPSPWISVPAPPARFIQNKYHRAIATVTSSLFYLLFTKKRNLITILRPKLIYLMDHSIPFLGKKVLILSSKLIGLI